MVFRFRDVDGIVKAEDIAQRDAIDALGWRQGVDLTLEDVPKPCFVVGEGLSESFTVVDVNFA